MFKYIKALFIFITIYASLAGLQLVKADMPAAWKKGAYAYLAQETLLADILNDFANSHGVILALDGIPEKIISGRLRASNAEAFLNRLALEHNLQWFFYNNTLYVSALSMQKSRKFKVTMGNLSDIKNSLKEMKLFQANFGWGESIKNNEVIVSGPPEYLNLIASFIPEPESKNEQKPSIMIFPLKYASVNDRDVVFRNHKMVVPGVVSLLKELLDKRGGQTEKNQGVNENFFHDALQNSAEVNLNAIMARSGSIDNDVSEEIIGRISADIRNNTILIRDDPRLKLNYKSLISNIDKPQKMIEIQAMIVDIDRKELEKIGGAFSLSSGNDSASFNSSFGGSSFFTGDSNSLLLNLFALEAKGAATVIATPNIMTLENYPAVIDFSETAYMRSIGERVAQVTPIVAGTSLRVTPRTIDYKNTTSIQLLLEIEDGKLQRDASGHPQGNKGSSISTQAMVEENRALVLGGFQQQEMRLYNKKVPFLGSIPILGSLFSSQSHMSSKSERVFIITPRLIGDQQEPSLYADNRYISASKKSGFLQAEREELRSRIQAVLMQLKNHQIPTGMHVGGEGVVLSEICNFPHAIKEFGQPQWYNSKDLQVTIGAVRNYSTQPQDLNHSMCQHERIFASMSWPKQNLKPGESTEIFIIIKPAPIGQNIRPSLLKEGGIIPLIPSP